MKIFLPVLIISILLISSCTPADPAQASPEPTLMQVDESPPLVAEPAQSIAATAVSAVPTPTIPPTPAPTELPPGVTDDAFTTMAITGHYMRAVLPIIKPGDVGATVDAAAVSPDGQYIAIS